MEDTEEISKLNEVYEELWKDAKTLIKDMKDGILMYRFSSILIFLMAVLTFSLFINYFSRILAGSTALWDIFNVGTEIFAIFFFIILGYRLFRFYNKLKDRYAKLLELEKDLED
ncbi:MAG: hypothetical protein OEX10_02560 [Candidatus Bathyarchaeota archaeon]|nr:hypothetical protein [Candidatus Bathyarchaeota archaeon]MDH5662936.1 hypothetical protein [Candidatus Bathyarchaeota archaeon]